MKNRIKEIRYVQQITQTELARRSGVSQAMISQIEQGRRSGRLDVYQRIAQGLGVSLAQLFQPENEAPRRTTLADLLEAPDASAHATELPIGNWSPTRLADWLLCPAKGAWSTGVWELPPDFTWPANDAARRGKAIHRFAEKRLLGSDRDAALIAAADETIGMAPDVWLSYTAAWEDGVWPKIGRPQVVEQRLEALIGDHHVTLVVDVVDQNGVIRDLKTTQRMPNPLTVIRETLQAPLYVAGWATSYGELRPFALDYLVSRKAGVTVVTIDVPVHDRDVERVTRQLDWAANQAQHPDRIIPNPLNKYGCTSCAFASLCAERFGTVIDIDVPDQTVAAS
jgi:transcriptional regulator with XRE-family HTH domain